MSKAVSYSLFFLSFIPLWITVIFIDGKSLIEGNENNCTEKISIALILLNIIICFIVLLVKINHKEHTYHRKGSRRENGYGRIFAFIHSSIVCV